MKKSFYSYFIIFIFSFVLCLNDVSAKKINEINVGDYIKMTPSSTSYTISSDLTGYSKDQTINPSELNLWRIIKKNDDGTVDVVSEYVSSTKIYFQGLNGYLNLVGGLNKVAAQYTNSKYVSATRHMGYSNQVEKCLETSMELCEKDRGYEKDYNLVKEAINTLIGKSLDGTNESYFLASRNTISESTSIKYSLRFIENNGNIGTSDLYLSNDIENADRESIRPILTLKADIDLPDSTIKEDGKDYYDLDSVNREESTKPDGEDENNKNQDNINDEKSQKPSSKNEVENPNTGNFVACVLLFSLIILTIFIFNMTKRRKIFKL